MDSSRSCLVSLILKPETFESFRCDQSVRLGVNLKNIHKVLKAAGSEDSLTISVDAQMDEILFTLINTRKRKSCYALKLINMPLQLVNLPRAMRYVATVELSSLEFLRLCKDIVAIGDCMTIAVTEEDDRKKVAFSAAGDKTIECQATISFTGASPPEEIKITMRRPIALDYSNRFIVLVSKAFTLSNSVKLKLHKRYPLSLLYTLEGESELEFFIAPKVREEASRPSTNVDN
eukprot:gnl/MRDRNA2_/MRDRNA2_83921_c1_seq1.p1 gnl/MRDRNA2_/MRDRNA2_83921_c1~~gnl/MRDRNA2_/MRDRNA2_83921_c1_seq1.p1  ORF type:complete len:274 (-),score=21.35 gnl/MRDRNA2_/MRDRNA2_83921_c1_seq1:1001-1699(-)